MKKKRKSALTSLRRMDIKLKHVCAKPSKVKWDNCCGYNEADQAERNKFQIVPIRLNPAELLTVLYPGATASANSR